jgi:hypothetical protein
VYEVAIFETNSHGPQLSAESSWWIWKHQKKFKDVDQKQIFSGLFLFVLIREYPSEPKNVFSSVQTRAGKAVIHGCSSLKNIAIS